MIISRPRAETDWKCPRKRYWNYEYAGQGIVTTNTSIELLMGTVVHDGLAAIARGLDIDEIAAAAYQQMVDSLTKPLEDSNDANEFVHEQATLVEGLVRGFYRSTWPYLKVQYPEILAVEQDMIYNLESGYKFPAKPDLVVRNEHGEVFYIEYKTTSNKKDNWIQSWNYAVQVHATTKAIEEYVGEPVTAIIVQGLYKGYESYGKQNSPFCYTYYRAGQPPFSSDEFLYEYKAGYKKRPVWEMRGGCKEWVAGMPEHILAEQFPQTPPIYPNRELIDKFFIQREVREIEIAQAIDLISGTTEEAKQNVLDVVFPQKFDQCSPSFGYGCPYKEICHGNIPEPLSRGWILRDISHEMKWKDSSV